MVKWFGYNNSDYPFHNFEDDTIKITIRTNGGNFTKKVYMNFYKNIFRVIQHKNKSIEVLKHSYNSPINSLNDSDI